VRITLLAVGRAKAGTAQALYEEYAKRLDWPLALVEVEERRKLSPAELKEREGALIAAALDEIGRRGRPLRVVALDEHGEALSSLAFARRLGRWQDEGCDIAFIIGGAEGLAESVTGAAQMVLSLGAMTWPHMLVRGLLAEQLYRGQQILSNHPYHRR